MKTSGFTLIEVVAVLPIMGLLTAAAVLSLAHTAGVHGFDAVCHELQQADALARSAARQSGRSVHLVYDLDESTILWQAADDLKPAALVHLRTGDEMQVRLSDRTSASGQIAIECSPAGYSQSYAVRLERASQEARWMVVAGLSGRIFWSNDDKQVDAIFRSLSSGGPAGSPGDDPH